MNISEAEATRMTGVGVGGSRTVCPWSSSLPGPISRRGPFPTHFAAGDATTVTVAWTGACKRKNT
jgi:hypothetical protein